jgi:hypothetical protein
MWAGAVYFLWAFQSIWMKVSFFPLQTYLTIHEFYDREVHTPNFLNRLS